MVKQYLAVSRRVLTGIIVAAGIGLGTSARLSAVTCFDDCGGCLISHSGCESCEGSGCDMVGYNCDKTCWVCGGDSGCGT